MSNKQLDALGDFFAFVIMPFNSEFDDIYKLGIKQAAIDSDVKAERLDEQIFDEGMLDRIFRQIEVSDFIIADLSNRNPNVFYELGYAHAKEKICILLTKDPTDIPFDLKHKRHIVYGDSISFLKGELVKNISWAKNEAKAKRENRIQIVFSKPTGELDRSEYTAEATLKFIFDLHNKTNRISSEISAVYLYSGNQWKVKVNGKDCPYNDSDVKPYKFRYVFAPPVVKIGKNGWAQIEIITHRVLAQVWKGDVLDDKYTLAGRGLLRVETVDGNIDHEFDFNLDVTYDEIPF